MTDQAGGPGSANRITVAAHADDAVREWQDGAALQALEGGLVRTRLGRRPGTA